MIKCDVDELALHCADKTLYDAAAVSPNGVVLFEGSWVEALESDPVSQRYPTFSRFIHTDKTATGCLPRWALAPRRTHRRGSGVCIASSASRWN